MTAADLGDLIRELDDLLSEFDRREGHQWWAALSIGGRYREMFDTTTPLADGRPVYGASASPSGYVGDPPFYSSGHTPEEAIAALVRQLSSAISSADTP